MTIPGFASVELHDPARLPPGWWVAGAVPFGLTFWAGVARIAGGW